MSEDAFDDKEFVCVVVSAVVASIVLAAVWPFIYPGFEYVLAWVTFGRSRELVDLLEAVAKSGSLYGER